MEIAFFPVPDMKTEINCAPQVSVADEFSFLLSSMLKTAQSGAPLETGLIDNTATVTSVPAGGAKDKPLEASPESEEAVEVKEDAKAAPDEEAVTETLSNAFPNELGVIAAPAELPVDAPSTVPFNGFYETSFPQKNQISVPVSVPAGVPLMNPPVQGRVVDSIASEVIAPQAAAPVKEGVKIRAGQTENPPEKENAHKNEKSRIEFAASLFQPQPDNDHFEVEIPAEEILKQTVVEPVSGPAIAASGEKSEAPHENAALFQALEQEPVERSEHSGKTEKAAIGQVRGKQPDMPAFAFQGSEGHSQDDTEAKSQPVQEIQAGKSENIMNNLSFEKILDAPVKEPSASLVRVAPLAAEVQEKVQAGIKVSVEQGGGEVKMKLNPESLGEVRIKLNVASGVVRAEITVESPEVKRVIEADSAFLRDSLGTHGLTLDKCVVEVGRSFEAGNRDKSGESFYGDEQRPMKDRDEKENRQNSGWHNRQFRKNHARHEDGGVDFFI